MQRQCAARSSAAVSTEPCGLDEFVVVTDNDNVISEPSSGKGQMRDTDKSLNFGLSRKGVKLPRAETSEDIEFWHDVIKSG